MKRNTLVNGMFKCNGGKKGFVLGLCAALTVSSIVLFGCSNLMTNLDGIHRAAGDAPKPPLYSAVYLFQKAENDTYEQLASYPPDYDVDKSVVKTKANKFSLNTEHKDIYNANSEKNWNRSVYEVRLNRKKADYRIVHIYIDQYGMKNTLVEDGPYTGRVGAKTPTSKYVKNDYEAQYGAAVTEEKSIAPDGSTKVEIVYSGDYAKYTVIHKVENTDGTFDEEKETLIGKTGTNTDAKHLTEYKGDKIDATTFVLPAITQVLINSDGSTTIELIYARVPVSYSIHFMFEKADYPDGASDSDKYDTYTDTAVVFTDSNSTLANFNDLTKEGKSGARTKVRYSDYLLERLDEVDFQNLPTITREMRNTYENEPDVENASIKKDGSTVVNVKYARKQNEYKIIYFGQNANTGGYLGSGSQDHGASDVSDYYKVTALKKGRVGSTIIVDKDARVDSAYQSGFELDTGNSNASDLNQKYTVSATDVTAVNVYHKRKMVSYEFDSLNGTISIDAISGATVDKMTLRARYGSDITNLEDARKGDANYDQDKVFSSKIGWPDENSDLKVRKEIAGNDTKITFKKWAGANGAMKPADRKVELPRQDGNAHLFKAVWDRDQGASMSLDNIKQSIIQGLQDGESADEPWNIEIEGNLASSDLHNMLNDLDGLTDSENKELTLSLDVTKVDFTEKKIGKEAFALETSGSASNLLVDIVLPNDIVEIGERAFANNSNLKSVNIPDALKADKMGARPFQGCINLKEFIVSSSNKDFKTYKKIDEATGKMAVQPKGEMLVASYPDGEHLVAYPSAVGTVEIPDEIVTIMQMAFYSCVDLMEFWGNPDKRLKVVTTTANSKLKEIEQYAFAISVLDEIRLLSPNLEKIGLSAFCDNSLGQAFDFLTGKLHVYLYTKKSLNVETPLFCAKVGDSTAGGILDDNMAKGFIVIYVPASIENTYKAKSEWNGFTIAPIPGI